MSEKLNKEKIISVSSIEEYKNTSYQSSTKQLLEQAKDTAITAKMLMSLFKKLEKYQRKKKTAFFSLNLTARKPEKNSPETNPYIIKFLKKVEWEPTKKAVFAGRLDYPSLDCANKLAILFIMVITNGPKDISKVYELTDWKKVDNLIESISKF